MKKERNSVIASRKIEHGVVKVEDGLLAAFMLVLTFSIIFQVVCRYVLKVSSPWCEEAPAARSSTMATSAST